MAEAVLSDPKLYYVLREGGKTANLRLVELGKDARHPFYLCLFFVFQAANALPPYTTASFQFCVLDSVPRLCHTVSVDLGQMSRGVLPFPILK